MTTRSPFRELVTAITGGFLLILALRAHADPCRLAMPDAAATLKERIEVGATLVTFCWFCDDAEPLPLRVRALAFRHHAPELVRDSLTGRQFAVGALEQAEKNRAGPMYEAIKARIDREYRDMGLDLDDPYIVEEKKDRLAMFLGFARQDYQMTTYDELLINGEPADARLLYFAGGNHTYASLGELVGCPMHGAPATVRYTPPERIPENEKPPVPFVADITGQCYDGSCPLPVWTVRKSSFLYPERDENTEPLARLKAGESVTPVRTVSHVTGVRVRVVRDHDRFLAGDVLYLLDSQAEGFYRIWHYGEVVIREALDVTFDEEAPCQARHDHWACAEGYPRERWWAKVERQDGTTAWVHDPRTVFHQVLSD